MGINQLSNHVLLPLSHTLRARILSLLRRLAINSSILGLPKGLYATAVEWASHISRPDCITEIYPAYSGIRVRPKVLGGEIPWEFFTFFDGMKSNEDMAYVASIPNGRIVGEGSILTEDDRLIGDVSREMIAGNDQKKHSIFSRIILPKRRYLRGSVAVLAVNSSDVYWHWLFDFMPRIHLLRNSPYSLEELDYIAVNKINHDFQREFLKLIDFPVGKIIECDAETHIKADRLIVPSLTQKVPTRWACEFVRTLVKVRHEEAKTDKRRRIYVTRSDAKGRRVQNEEEISRLLEGLGFETCVLTGMSVADQAALFDSSEIVVSPHGSGLSNLVFCKPGTKVIELFSPIYINPCYWVLSNTVGLDYYCHIGVGQRPPEPPQGADPIKWFFSSLKLDKKHTTDISVDAESLMKLVEMALSDSTISN